jgi:hypothetical protein
MWAAPPVQPSAPGYRVLPLGSTSSSSGGAPASCDHPPGMVAQPCFFFFFFFSFSLSLFSFFLTHSLGSVVYSHVLERRAPPFLVQVLSAVVSIVCATSARLRGRVPCFGVAFEAPLRVRLSGGTGDVRGQVLPYRAYMHPVHSAHVKIGAPSRYRASSVPPAACLACRLEEPFAADDGAHTHCVLINEDVPRPASLGTNHGGMKSEKKKKKKKAGSEKERKKALTEQAPPVGKKKGYLAVSMTMDLRIGTAHRFRWLPKKCEGPDRGMRGGRDP